MRSERLRFCAAIALACCAFGLPGCRGRSAQKNIEPVYDPDTGRLRQLKYDSDSNGRVDTVSHMDGARVLRIEIDKDEDGKVERWEYYDTERKLEKVGVSRASDGVENVWSYIGPDGKVSRVEEDTDGDRAVDKWELYEAGRLASVAFDEMHLGRPDRRLTYLPDGSVTVEVDPQGSGQWSPVEK